MSNPGAWGWEKQYADLQAKYEEAKKTNTLLCLENAELSEQVDKRILSAVHALLAKL